MLKKVVIFASLIGCVVSANSAGSASFGVTGTITPSPCVMTLNSGNANFGDRTSLQIKEMTGTAELYDFGNVSIPLSVMCGHPTKVVMSFADNLAGKNFPLDANDNIRFGIVDNNGTAGIGTYQIDLAGLTIDGVAPAVFLTAINGSPTWSKSGPTALPSSYAAPGWQVGFAKKVGAVSPDSLSNIGGTINLHMWISKKYVENSKNMTAMKGSGTVTLSYL